MVLLAAAVVPAALRAEEEPRLTPATLNEWRRYLAPSAEELSFREIPWHAGLRSAVREARLRGMPVLLWAMNGHPLGCT